MVWILWALSIFGLAYVVGHSHLTLPFREWLATKRSLGAGLLLIFMECAACQGWWYGFALAKLGFLPQEIGGHELLRVVVIAFAAAASNLLLARQAGLAGGAS